MEQTAPFILEMLMKGGASGLLIVIICVLGVEVARLRKQANKIFAEREGYRLRYVLYRSECKRAKIDVDESGLQPIPEST